MRQLTSRWRRTLDRGFPFAVAAVGLAQAPLNSALVGQVTAVNWGIVVLGIKGISTFGLIISVVYFGYQIRDSLVRLPRSTVRYTARALLSCCATRRGLILSAVLLQFELLRGGGRLTCG